MLSEVANVVAHTVVDTQKIYQFNLIFTLSCVTLKKLFKYVFKVQLIFWQCTRIWVVSPVSLDLFDRLVRIENGRYQSGQVSLTKTTMKNVS